MSGPCLGTMTFGEQNTQEEAFDQMDYSVEKGVNFFLILQSCMQLCQEKKLMVKLRKLLEIGLR